MIQYVNSVETNATQVPASAAIEAANEVQTKTNVAMTVTAAEAAIRDGDTARAIVLLEQLLSTVSNPDMPRARELLGLLRERGGRIAEARTIYRHYLESYPNDEGAPRVRLRLAELGEQITTPLPGASTIRPDRGAGRAAAFHGVITQTYLHDRSLSTFMHAIPETASTQPDSRDNVDEVLSTADVTGSAPVGSALVTVRAALGHVAEYRPVTLVGADRKHGSYDLLDQFYVDATHQQSGVSVRFGRQKFYHLGVFGRFDGIHVAGPVGSGVQLAAIAGYPIWSERQTTIDRTRSFYGLSASYSTPGKRFSASLYWLDQRAAGLADRQAVGAETSISLRDVSLYGLVDYDIALRRVNTAFLNATIRIDRRSHISFSVQHISAPFLALGNSVLGQPSSSLAALRLLLPRDALQRAAIDRTFLTQSAAMTYSRDLSTRWQAILDVSVFRTGASPASFGVAAFPAPGVEWFAGAELIGSGIVARGDIWTAQLRLASSPRSRSYEGSVSVRFPATPAISLRPRLSVLFRDQRLDVGKTCVLAPSIRASWRVSKGIILDFEGGGNFVWQRYATSSDGRRFERAFIGRIGYKIQF